MIHPTMAAGAAVMLEKKDESLLLRSKRTIAKCLTGGSFTSVINVLVSNLFKDDVPVRRNEYFLI
jgi:hypothetical protein